MQCSSLTGTPQTQVTHGRTAAEAGGTVFMQCSTMIGMLQT